MTARTFAMAVVAMGVVASGFVPQPAGPLLWGAGLVSGMVIGGLMGFSYALYLGDEQRRMSE